MKIHKEGYKIIRNTFIIIAAILTGLYFLIGCGTAFICSSIAGLLIFIFVLRFFRSPKRVSVIDKKYVVSPCDGKIVQIQEVEENEFLKCKCIQVSVFMSVFNVHVNYFPVGGNVVYSKHHHGKYIVASYPKSSELNERTSVVVETPDKVQVLFRQIAGYIARRIVCYAEAGNHANQCDQMGFIKFGSRMDLFLPLDTKVNVKLGDKVKACTTIIAKLK